MLGSRESNLVKRGGADIALTLASLLERLTQRGTNAQDETAHRIIAARCEHSSDVLGQIGGEDVAEFWGKLVSWPPDVDLVHHQVAGKLPQVTPVPSPNAPS